MTLWRYCPAATCRRIVPWTEVMADGQHHERNFSSHADTDSFPDRWAVCKETLLHVRVLRLRYSNAILIDRRGEHRWNR